VLVPDTNTRIKIVKEAGDGSTVTLQVAPASK
jgi:immune inhibitor A